jgi:hypothetical protein
MCTMKRKSNTFQMCQKYQGSFQHLYLHALEGGREGGREGEREGGFDDIVCYIVFHNLHCSKRHCRCICQTIWYVNLIYYISFLDEIF